MVREYTDEECRDMFLENLVRSKDYWCTVKLDPEYDSLEYRMGGMVHSLPKRTWEQLPARDVASFRGRVERRRMKKKTSITGRTLSRLQKPLLGLPIRTEESRRLRDAFSKPFTFEGAPIGDLELKLLTTLPRKPMLGLGIHSVLWGEEQDEQETSKTPTRKLEIEL